MSNLFYLPRVHSQPGAKIYMRVSGTSTPQNVYSDIDLTVPLSNPVVADADGYFAPIYLDPSLPDYRMIHTDGSDPGNDYTLELLLEPIRDDIPSSSNVSSGYRIEGGSPAIVFYETDGGSGAKAWRLRVASEVMYLEKGTDDETTWTALMTLPRTGVLIESGSFTGTLTGVTTTVTGTVKYARAGNMVTLMIPAMTGTSNAVTCTLTGLPVALEPTTIANQAVAMYAFEDNTVAVYDVAARIDANSSTITLLKANASGGFTNSGTKGFIGNVCITYVIG